MALLHQDAYGPRGGLLKKAVKATKGKAAEPARMVGGEVLALSDKRRYYAATLTAQELEALPLCRYKVVGGEVHGIEEIDAGGQGIV